MERSTIPSLWALAFSPAAAIRSQGKSGNPDASGVNSFSAPVELTQLRQLGHYLFYQL
jgi:hypothetical protein